MRYVALHLPDDSDDAEHEWAVEHPEGMFSGLREWEAHVIEFTLNGVAEGGRLALDVEHVCTCGAPRQIEWYAGPKP